MVWQAEMFMQRFAAVVGRPPMEILRDLRMKQDIVPGMEIPLHFQADQIGTYEVPCSELCGLGHFQMRTTMQVMSMADFEAWQQQMQAQK